MIITTRGKLVEHETGKDISVFYTAMRKILSKLTPEAAQEFMKLFNEKLNEQKRTQENSGASR